MKIALLGDIALIGKYDLEQDGGAIERVAYLKQHVADCDFVVGNLESPLTSLTQTRERKGVYLRSAPRNAEMLNYIGVTHVTLANNHMFDYGTAGARETVETLECAGIGYVGLNGRPAVLIRGKDKVLLEGFCCYSANATHYGTRGFSTSLLTPKRLDAFLKKAERRECFPLASIHFGIEGVHYPTIEHVRLFEDMARRHRYLMHGNHPHAVQGIRERNGSLFCYALGNTCFDDCLETSIGQPCIQSAEEHRSLVVKVTVEDGAICDHETFGITDLPDGKLCPDEQLATEMAQYSKVLAESEECLLAARKDELDKQALQRAPRNLTFIKNRLNRKYVGAYMAGRSHAKAYAKLMKDYL